MPALLREWQKRATFGGDFPTRLHHSKFPGNLSVHPTSNWIDAIILFCNCPGNRKIKYIKLSNTNKNVKSILVRCNFPLNGSLALPSIEDNKLNESLKPLNHQHNARNTKYMSFSYRVNEMQLFLSLPTPRWIVEISAFGRRKNNCLFQSVTRLPQQ